MPTGPDFLCIGAQKAGTGWLHDQLAEHSAFWTPPVKELHYFDDPKRFARKFNEAHVRERLIRRGRWPPDARDERFYRVAREISSTGDACPDAYARLFDQKLGKLSGEFTPAYSTLTDQEVAGIASRFPQLKIIFIVREPIERFWSQLCMALRNGKLQRSGPDDLDGVLSFARRSGVVARSFPSVTFTTWSRYVAKERFGLFFFDHLQRDPVWLRREILDFLGANPEVSSRHPPDFNRKQGKCKIQMTDAVREALRVHFCDELERCAELFGGPASEWPARYKL